MMYSYISFTETDKLGDIEVVKEQGQGALVHITRLLT
jgi:hypothetical protein